MIGFDLKSNPHTSISPYAWLMYRYDFNNDENNIDAIFNGNPATAFTVEAVQARRSGFDADLGINFQANPQLALYAGYQGTWRKDLNNTASPPASAIRSVRRHRHRHRHRLRLRRLLLLRRRRPARTAR